MRVGNTLAWQRLLARCAEDPFFLGSALTSYRTARGFDSRQLAEWLGCPPASLDRLSLCRLPDAENPRYHDDVRKIAAFVPCDADRLLSLLREVAVLSALRDTRKTSPESLLMAARDRKQQEGDES